METEAHLHTKLVSALKGIVLDYLQKETQKQSRNLRSDLNAVSLEAESQRIVEEVVPNLKTTLDVYMRQLLYPSQQQRATEWLRAQSYMYRREDQDNRPADL